MRQCLQTVIIQFYVFMVKISNKSLNFRCFGGIVDTIYVDLCALK